jgi:hypothetical protein
MASKLLLLLGAAGGARAFSSLPKEVPTRMTYGAVTHPVVGSNALPPAGYRAKAGSGPCMCRGGGRGLDSCGELCCANSPFTATDPSSGDYFGNGGHRTDANLCWEADPNRVIPNAAGAGGWGGTCVCPDGTEYLAGDNGDYCASLLCIGGIMKSCNQATGAWSHQGVFCAPPWMAPTPTASGAGCSKGAGFTWVASGGALDINTLKVQMALQVEGTDWSRSGLSLPTPWDADVWNRMHCAQHCFENGYEPGWITVADNTASADRNCGCSAKGTDCSSAAHQDAHPAVNIYQVGGVPRCGTDHHVSGGKCVACPSGSTNAAGDKIADGDTTCDFPAGICGANQHVSIKRCVECPPGTRSDGGDDPKKGVDTGCVCASTLTIGYSRDSRGARTDGSLHLDRKKACDVQSSNAHSFNSDGELFINACVGAIAYDAFDNCKKIKKVTFKHTVSNPVTIGRFAFDRSGVEIVDVPPRATFKSHSFSQAYSLKRLVFRENSDYQALKIEANAFDQSGLQSTEVLLCAPLFC